MQFPSLLGHIQELLGVILKSDRPADSLIDTFFRSRKYLGSHDRRFIAETTYGVLRHLRRCEHILSTLLPSDVLGNSDKDRFLLLISVYLVRIGGRTDISVEMLSQRLHSSHIKQILPAFLEKLISQKEEGLQDPGLRYSFPDWMVERLAAQYGKSEAEEILQALNEQAPLTLRVNTLKTNVEDCQAALKAEGVETERTRLSPFGLIVPKRINIFSLQSFRNGLFEVQDEGSQLLPLLIDPKPTARVLDACAGAGGKTLELAALMKNRGEIVATDLNGFRLDQLRKRARRAGAFNIRVKEIDTIADLKEEFEGAFDVVLVDAPCSGLGTIRRNPGMKWSVTEATVREVSLKQSHILEAASSLVKPGGRLAYATCTILKEENEDVVEAFLARHSGFRWVDRNDMLKLVNLRNHGDRFSVKLLPHCNGTDGFFFAMMERARDSSVASAPLF